MRRLFILLVVAIPIASWSRAAEPKPNIVYILADDLGYGDVHCLNPKRGKIPTPNLDRLAAQGMAFTDAHGSSSVCSPSRYSILTGRYNWRSRLQNGVLGPYGDTLIPAARTTVASLLKQQGYATACVGKWHLGWNWPRKGKEMDFTQPIPGGPTTVGFNYYFGTDVPNYPPYCFIENDHTIISHLTKHYDGAKDKTHRHVTAPGLGIPGWKQENILPAITDKTCELIARHAKEQKPFFIYFPLTSPHTPLAVTKEWEGRSHLGLYADYVMETDAMVGRVLTAIEKGGVADNTLVIFSSDNGCAPYIGVHELEAKGHFPSAQFRGYKADAWDGGHRIPFIARWPGKIKSGTHCGQLVCEMDLMATCADLLGVKLPATAGEDSVSLLPLLKGNDKPIRESLVHHSIQGKFALREGKWKLVFCPGSGGWGMPTDAGARKRKLPSVQLYDMSVDEGERKNLQAEHPDIVKRLTAKLKQIVADGRSTPGPKRNNDVPVDIFKKGQ